MKGCLKVLFYLFATVVGLSVLVAIFSPDHTMSNAETLAYLDKEQKELDAISPPDNTSPSNIIETVNEEPAVQEESWSGVYVGAEMCSMGRDKDKWSNKYGIALIHHGSTCTITGIYFQRNTPLKATIKGDEIIIHDQSFGSFRIRGKGIKAGKKLTIDFEVDVLVYSDPKEWKTNICTAEYNLEKKL